MLQWIPTCQIGIDINFDGLESTQCLDRGTVESIALIRIIRTCFRPFKLMSLYRTMLIRKYSPTSFIFNV